MRQEIAGTLSRFISNTKASGVGDTSEGQNDPEPGKHEKWPV